MERTSDYGVSVVQARCGEEPETKGAHNLRRFHELYGTPIGDEGVSRTIVMFIQVVIKILYIHFHLEIYMIDVILFFCSTQKIKIIRYTNVIITSGLVCQSRLPAVCG